MVNHGWTQFLRIGDISAAFLQGHERSGTQELYLEQPTCGLPGLHAGQLLRVKKGIYGLPDAPRVWFETLRGALTKEMGFHQMSLDVAMFVHWRKDGSISALLATHVDDCIVATDGQPDSEDLVKQLTT